MAKSAGWPSLTRKLSMPAIERVALVESTCRCGCSFKIWVGEDGTNYGGREPSWPRYFEFPMVACALARKGVRVTVCRTNGDSSTVPPRPSQALLYETCSDCWELPDAALAARAIAGAFRREAE